MHLIFIGVGLVGLDNRDLGLGFGGLASQVLITSLGFMNQ